jgi:hypothetical protein
MNTTSNTPYNHPNVCPLAEHAAAMTQNLNLKPRKYSNAGTPINNHVANEQSLTSLVSLQVWKPSKRGRPKSQVCGKGGFDSITPWSILITFDKSLKRPGFTT